MAAQGLSKKRKATASTTTTPAKKPRNTTKDERKGVSAPPKKSKAASALPVVEPVADVETDVITFDEQEEAADAFSEDDQTAALLKGFESSSDEDEDAPQDPTEIPIAKIPSIPTSTALQTSLSTANAKTSDQPGVIYIGRIPHGFYEHQMRAYLSQFGDISRLRLSRNKQTGASKHYAFVEFASAEVAKIVADTMDNYLMFGHILKVKLIPRDQVHAQLFKGANRRFKKVPWNRIERFRLQRTDRDGWQRRVEGEEKRRKDKAEKLKALGYEFEAPGLRKVNDVPVPAKAVEVEETAKQVESAHVEALESGAHEGAQTEQGPVSAEPLAIATMPRGDGPTVVEESVLAPSADAEADVSANPTEKTTEVKPEKKKRKAKAAAQQDVDAVEQKASPKLPKAGKKQDAERRRSKENKAR